MTLSVIIVNYNGREVLPDCLESLQRFLGRIYFEVLVVDNASRDDSVEFLRKEFPWVAVIENSENLGFARGCNIGMSSSKGEMILFLNPDTRLQNDALTPLLDFLLKNPSVGLIGPRIVYTDGRFQPSCGKLPTALGEIRDKMLYALAKSNIAGVASLLERKYTNVRSVGWLTGACLLARREAVDAVQGFDERIFMYFEDKDLCKRIAEAGWSVVYFPGAIVSHLLGKSSQGSDSIRLRHIYRTSQRYYYKKHLGTFDRAFLKTYLMIRGAVGLG